MYGCSPDLIATKSPAYRLIDWLRGTDVLNQMKRITIEAGFGLKDAKLIRFGVGEGVTVAQLLSESMQDMHTYPEMYGCAHVWLDYCCYQTDNTPKGNKWWELTIKLLKPTVVVDYPTIYIPVQPDELVGLGL